MDDKTFMAQYVANESTRLSERLKKMVQSDSPPTEEEKEAIFGDMEATLSRLKRTLEQIQRMVDEENAQEDEKTGA